MYKFGKRSLDCLESVSMILQLIAHRVLERSDVDFGIISGLRTAEEQNELYKQGRDGDDRPLVTHLDGYKKKSRHQGGNAIDFAVYHFSKLTWTDYKSYIKVAELFKQEFDDMQTSGFISEDVSIELGCDWKWKDYPHIQINIKG